MLAVPLLHCQAYYDFPDLHTFHGDEPAMKSVAVRKVRGPNRAWTGMGFGGRCGTAKVRPVRPQGIS